MPNVVAPAGVTLAGGTSDSPDADASSTTAGSPRARHRAWIGRPSGSWAAAGATASRRLPRSRRACPRRRRPAARAGSRRRAGPRPACGQRPRDLDGGQRSLVRVGRDQDAWPTIALGASGTPALLEVLRDADHRRALLVGQLDDLERQLSRPERGSFMVEPSSANSRARRRSSSRFMTAWRITKLIRDSPSSSWLRWIRMSRSTWPRPSRPARSDGSIRWPISTA